MLTATRACSKAGDSDTGNQVATTAGLLVGQWWQSDFNQECFKDAHAVLTYLLAVPGLIGIALGCPLAVGECLWL